jgi:hypothetical protein
MARLTGKHLPIKLLGRLKQAETVLLQRLRHELRRRDANRAVGRGRHATDTISAIACGARASGLGVDE